jgi:hypothetical protein
MEPVSRITFFYHAYADHSAPFESRMGTETPTGARLGGPSLTFLNVDGGRSRTYNSGTSLGGRRRCFLKLMVGAPRFTTLAPFKGPIVNVS